MQYITKLIFFALIFWVLPSQAQKKINKNFRFQDGVYSSHIDFRKDSPKFKLFEIIDFDYKLDGDKNILFLSDKTIQKLSKSNIKSIKEVWGICIKGIPYMKINPTDNKNEVYFVRYHILGRLCYLYYPIFEEQSVEFFVYNPYSGQKMGRKTIVNKEKKLVEKLMHFETGEIKNFDSKNLISLIKDDPSLIEVLVDLSENEKDKKLFKAIKIYNDRNPIIITEQK